MRKLFFTLIMAFFSLPLLPQNTDSQFLHDSPVIPADLCSMKPEEVNVLREKISTLRMNVKMESEKYSREVEAFIKANENNIKANMVAQSGMSQEDIQKLQSGKMTDAEKKAMADKMIQQQANISMSEAQSVAKMSNQGKEAWAQAYATEQAAAAQANPSSYQANQQKTNRMMELTSLTQHLKDSLFAIQSEFNARFQAIENDPAIKASRDSLEVWSAKLTAMSGIVSESEAKVVDRLYKKSCEEKQKLCELYNKKYSSLMKEYQIFTKSSLNAYDRLERANFELMELQTGVKYPYKSGKAGFSAVINYLDRLDASFSCYNPCTY